MTTIYVVEEGYYSDRHPVAAFTNEDDAAAMAYAGDERSVVEVELDPPDEPRRPLRPGERYYWVRMNADGNEATADVQWDDVPEPSAPPELRVNEGFQPAILVTECWADSPEHAIKIANERRTAWLIAGRHLRPGPKSGYGWQVAEISSQEAAQK